MLSHLTLIVLSETNLTQEQVLQQSQSQSFSHSPAPDCHTGNAALISQQCSSLFAQLKTAKCYRTSKLLCIYGLLKTTNGEGYMKNVAVRIWSYSVQRHQWESFHTLSATINHETHWCLLKVTNPSGCQEKTQCFSAAAQTRNHHLMKQKKS